MLKDKIILLTGGTGSLGYKFVEIILKQNPKAIRVFSRNESKQIEMDGKFNDKRLRFLIGDVQDKNRLKRAMNDVDIVIHMAALKHISICEYNPMEAIKTNILGAVNIIDAALEMNIDRVLTVSSDKAVEPTTMYGATKMTAERLFIQSNFYSGKDGPKFSCVRYGNFAGSSGSVILLFRKQKESGVLTLTDKRMTRFWITLQDGIEFMVKCLNLMQGGEIFIPKMPATKLVDLAEAIAPDVEQKIIGIRPGEKLHETMLTEIEATHSGEFDNYYVIYPEFPESVSMGGQKKMMINGKAIPEGFNFNSNTAKILSVGEITKLLEKI